MQVILSDHNCEGQAEALFDVLDQDQTWLQLVPMQLKWFRHIDLSVRATDEEVWRLCQEQGYILLTGNRSNDDDEDSLESIMRRLLIADSLPVITIGNLKRVIPDLAYRKRCAERLAEIVHNLANYRGTGRVFIP